jgi:hypothetical protein
MIRNQLKSEMVRVIEPVNISTIASENGKRDSQKSDLAQGFESRRYSKR